MGVLWAGARLGYVALGQGSPAEAHQILVEVFGSTSRIQFILRALCFLVQSIAFVIFLLYNLADKQNTHVAVALRVIQALRRLDPAERPDRCVGCEVWRALDWMVDSDKVMMDLSHHENLQFALLGVFDSQIAGGKRYDLASMGRRVFRVSQCG